MQQCKIVGILNTTPDSYFDGGKFNHIDAALKHVEQMITEGADIIDVGGESSGPGSKDVSVEQELDRTIHIIKAIKQAFPNQAISIDTYKQEVARKAVEAGATMVNDVQAGRGDSEMLPFIAESGVDYVLMYSKDATARTTVEDQDYEDVIGTIKDFLAKRISASIEKGVKESQIIVDPGLGHFVSAKPEYSYTIIDQIQAFTEIAPVFISPSRKSFLAGPNNLPPSQRLPATIEASKNCVANGASYLRTHDVAAIVESVRGIS